MKTGAVGVAPGTHPGRGLLGSSLGPPSPFEPDPPITARDRAQAYLYVLACRHPLDPQNFDEGLEVVQRLLMLLDADREGDTISVAEAKLCNELDARLDQYRESSLDVVKMLMRESLGHRLKRIAPIYATICELCEENGLPRPTLSEATQLVAYCERRDGQEAREFAMAAVFAELIPRERLQAVYAKYFPTTQTCSTENQQLAQVCCQQAPPPAS